MNQISLNGRNIGDFHARLFDLLCFFMKNAKKNFHAL